MRVCFLLDIYVYVWTRVRASVRICMCIDYFLVALSLLRIINAIRQRRRRDEDAKKISVGSVSLYIYYIYVRYVQSGRGGSWAATAPRSRSPLDGFQRSCYNIIIYYDIHAFTDFPPKISEINLTGTSPPPPTPKDRSRQ